MEESESSALLILYMGMGGMFFLAVALVGFVVLYNRRLLKQQLKLQEQKIFHQQQLLDTTIQIQDEERRRFAADLHDEIGGGISTILLSLAQLKNKLLNAPKIEHQADVLRDQLNYLLKTTREISYNIMPPTLETFGLQEALNDLCFSLNETTQIKVNYEWLGREKRLNFSTELAIYRIAKELLVNAIKHAQANLVSLNVNHGFNKFELVVTDNGVGFDATAFTRSTGIKNMHHRALIIGAVFDINSISASGTTARLTLNL